LGNYESLLYELKAMKNAKSEILNLVDENPLHTNFKISTSGETIFLSNNDENIIDQLTRLRD